MPEDKIRKAARDKARSNVNRLRLAEYKMRVGCVDCGYNENAYALEFDHLPGIEKKRCVAAFTYGSWDSIMKEVEKCEVVCANCHAIRTGERAGWHKQASMVER